MSRITSPVPITLSAGQTLSGVTLAAEQLVTVTRGGTMSDVSFSRYDTVYVSHGGLVGQTLDRDGTIYVVGGTATDTTIVHGGDLELDGGAGRDAKVFAGGLETVADATSVDSVIKGGVQKIVAASGRSIAATLAAGGLQIVSAGQVSHTHVLRGGEQLVYGGSIEQTVVASGGAEVLTTPLSPGGSVSATATLVQAGGLLQVAGGDSAIAATIEAGGTLAVSPLFGLPPGALLTGTEVQSGATLLLLGDASERGAFLDDGARVVSATVAIFSLLSGTSYEDGVITAAGSALSGTMLAGNVFEHVYAGGIAAGTVVVGANGAFAQQFVDRQGIATDTIVSSGGLQQIAGAASGTTLMSGGTQFVLSAGYASGTSIQQGGYQVASGGALAQGSTILAGGEQALASNNGTAAVASATIISAGGVQSIGRDGVATSSFVFDGGLQTVADGGVSSAAMVGRGGLLSILAGGSAGYTGLGVGGAIDIAAFAYVPGGTATLNATDLLVVHEGTGSYKLQLQGSYAGDQFRLNTDGAGGTMITLLEAPVASAAAIHSGEFLPRPAAAPEPPRGAIRDAGAYTQFQAHETQDQVVPHHL